MIKHGEMEYLAFKTNMKYRVVKFIPDDENFKSFSFPGYIVG